MSRWLLGAGILVIAIAVAGLLWQLRGGGDPPAGPGPDPRQPPVPTAGPRPPELAGPGTVSRRSVDPDEEEDPNAGPPIAGGMIRLPTRPREPGAQEASEAARQDQAMSAAERLFQDGDHEAARAAAHQLLQVRPDDPRMLRVVVLSACALGVGKEARQYYPRLATGERGPVVARCRRHGIALDH